MASIELSRINKAFGETAVLQDVDLQVEDGAFLVLVGPSGCGKSTLLRVLAGLEEVDSGDIIIGEKRVNELPPAKRGIAMVFQSYALYPHMTVRQNMAFGLRLGGAGQGGDRRGGRQGRGVARHRASARPAPEDAVRRPAPARRDRPRDRARAGRLPVRRAALQPRRGASRQDALRVRPAPPAAEDDHRLRDPRPGRGDDARRPHRHPRSRARSCNSAPPAELYEHPATVFVAGFIGSPRMNFFEGVDRAGRGRRRAGAPARRRRTRRGGRCRPAPRPATRSRSASGRSICGRAAAGIAADVDPDRVARQYPLRLSRQRGVRRAADRSARRRRGGWRRAPR